MDYKKHIEYNTKIRGKKYMIQVDFVHCSLTLTPSSRRRGTWYNVIEKQNNVDTKMQELFK